MAVVVFQFVFYEQGSDFAVELHGLGPLSQLAPTLLVLLLLVFDELLLDQLEFAIFVEIQELYLFLL